MRRLARAFDASDVTRAAPSAPLQPGRRPGYYRRRALHWARVSSLAQQGLTLTLILLGLAALTWLYDSGRLDTWRLRTLSSFQQQSSHLGFRVTALEIEGRYFTTTQEVRRALGILDADTLIGFDPGAARERLMALPWVEEASVRRVLEGKLYVRLSEYQPIALWQNGTESYGVDREGRLIALANVAPLSDMLSLAGAGAPDAAPALITALTRTPLVARRLVGAIYVGERRWDLYLEPGLQVLLPEAGLAAALEQLETLQRENHLLDRAIERLDLRLGEPILITLPDPSGEAPIQALPSTTTGF